MAQALSVLVADHDALTDCLKRYADTFNRLHVAVFLRKLGLPENMSNGNELVGKTLQMLHEGKADMTAFFRCLSSAVVTGKFSPCADVCVNPAAFDAWFAYLPSRL